MAGPRKQVRGVMKKARARGPFNPLARLDAGQVVDRRGRRAGRSKRAI